MSKRMISLPEAAEELGTSLRTVRRLVSQGLLPAYKVGGSKLVRINSEDLAKVLKPVTPSGRD